MVDFILSAGKIHTENGILNQAAIRIKEGCITEIDSLTSQAHLTFPESFHIVPGFIDLHIHGADGYDVMDASPVALEKISAALAREGTTSYLATTMTATLEDINRVVLNVQRYMQSPSLGASLLGIHLEGPFISPQKVGAQRLDLAIAPNEAYFLQWQKLSGDKIKLVTLAPELPNSLSFIEFLHKNAVVVSIGHTDATYAETVAAVQAGCSHVTHLFNAMRGMHHREPGVLTAALLSSELSAELILDGVHLHPAMVELALRVKGKEKIILVTDAMRAKCMADGEYTLGGQTVFVTHGQAKLADGTLAGSTLTMPQAIKNMMKFTQCSLENVLPFVSANPAKTLKIFDKKGSIAQGKDADLVVLNDQLEVVMTICRGEIVYTSH